MVAVLKIGQPRHLVRGVIATALACGARIMVAPPGVAPPFRMTLAVTHQGFTLAGFLAAEWWPDRRKPRGVRLGVLELEPSPGMLDVIDTLDEVGGNGGILWLQLLPNGARLYCTPYAHLTRSIEEARSYTRACEVRGCWHRQFMWHPAQHQLFGEWVHALGGPFVKTAVTSHDFCQLMQLASCRACEWADYGRVLFDKPGRPMALARLFDMTERLDPPLSAAVTNGRGIPSCLWTAGIDNTAGHRAAWLVWTHRLVDREHYQRRLEPRRAPSHWVGFAAWVPEHPDRLWRGLRRIDPLALPDDIPVPLRGIDIAPPQRDAEFVSCVPQVAWERVAGDEPTPATES